MCRPKIQMRDFYPENQVRLITRLYHPVHWVAGLVFVAHWATFDELTLASAKVEQFDSGRREFMLGCNGDVRDFLVNHIVLWKIMHFDV